MGLEVGAAPLAEAGTDRRAELAQELVGVVVRPHRDGALDRGRHPFAQRHDEQRRELGQEPLGRAGRRARLARRGAATHVRRVDRGCEQRGPRLALALRFGQQAIGLESTARATHVVEQGVLLVLEETLRGAHDVGHEGLHAARRDAGARRRRVDPRVQTAPERSRARRPLRPSRAAAGDLVRLRLGWRGRRRRCLDAASPSVAAAAASASWPARRRGAHRRARRRARARSSSPPRTGAAPDGADASADGSPGGTASGASAPLPASGALNAAMASSIDARIRSSSSTRARRRCSASSSMRRRTARASATIARPCSADAPGSGCASVSVASSRGSSSWSPSRIANAMLLAGWRGRRGRRGGLRDRLATGRARARGARRRSSGRRRSS